jgi:excisionase family DNA binding protein
MTERSRFRLTYTVEEAAALVGVARSTMYDLVHRGEVPAVRVGRRLFVTAPTIEALTGVVPPTPADLAHDRPEVPTTDPVVEREDTRRVSAARPRADASERSRARQPHLFG